MIKCFYLLIKILLPSTVPGIVKGLNKHSAIEWQNEGDEEGVENRTNTVFVTIMFNNRQTNSEIL